MARVALVIAILALASVASAVNIYKHHNPIVSIDANGERAQQYIVVMNQNANGKHHPFTAASRDSFLASVLPSFRAFSARQDGQHVYSQPGFIGFSAMLSAAELSIIANDTQVAYIEEDQVITLDRHQAVEVNDIDVPTWGCDRSDQKALPLDHIYHLPITKEEAVAIPNIYVVDTGVYDKHVEFEGRAAQIADFVKDGRTQDCNGHGTHCAGTAGGKRTGIAPFANIFGVRVLNCQGSGTYAGVIAGINFVGNNHTKPAVMTMSLGGGYSKAVNDATAATMAAGVTTTVASGNENSDACNTSPASTPGAITVNAMQITDNVASFSNYGKCTTLYAPGVNVVSTWYTSPTEYKSLSGTSMATPHVAGYAALFLATKPTASHKEVHDAMICAATQGVIKGVPANTPNLFFYLNKEAMAKCLA
jgi:hypothetical protein